MPFVVARAGGSTHFAQFRRSEDLNGNVERPGKVQKSTFSDDRQQQFESTAHARCSRELFNKERVVKSGCPGVIWTARDQRGAGRRPQNSSFKECILTKPPRRLGRRKGLECEMIRRQER